MKKSLMLLFFFYQFLHLFSQHPSYKIDFYSPREYGKGHEAQNFSCVQDKNGILYFGNGGGVLQYDGINWSFIPVKNQSSWIRTLAVGEDNLIYVGADNEFGYLKPDTIGKMVYVSLSDQLPENQKIFLRNMRLWAWNRKVAFQYEEALYLYSDGKLTFIHPGTSFHLSFVINNELFIRQRGVGIMKLTGNSLELVEGTESLKDFRIMSVLSDTDTTKLVLVTYDDGFWLVDKNSFRGSKIKVADNNIFSKSGIYEAIRLKDGNIALITNFYGIIITDKNFNILSVVNKDTGLKDNGVLSIMQDYQGNIWAGHNKGIVHIYYSSPVTMYGPESGVSGSVRAIERYKENVYIGTTDGLYIQKPEFKNLSGAFVQVAGYTEEVKGLALTDKSLIIGTSNELSEIIDNKKYKIADLEINSVYYSPKLKILAVSAKNFFALYKYTNKWEKIKVIPEITEDITRFEESDTGKVTVLWMGTALQGALRLKLSEDLKYKVDKYSGETDGLIGESWIYPFKIDDNIVFSQHNGLMTFVDEETNKYSLPDSLKNRPEFYRGYFDNLEIEKMEERIKLPFYYIRDTKNRIYVNLDGELGYFDKTDSLNFLYQPFCLTDIGKTNVIFYEENGICWIGGDDGLLMYDENYPKNYNIDFKTLITKVSCGAFDSVIFYGFSGTRVRDKPNDRGRENIVLNYRLNTVTFSLAAPFFEGQGRMKFSSRLTGEGQDTSYSMWETGSKVTFRNLREGEYAFAVKAMNAYGHKSQVANFRFRILSPWYRKKWAYAAYLMIASTLIYGGVRLYTKRLVEQNKRLEKIVEQRTHEINFKNIELEKQKEEIVASINYANKIQNAVLPSVDLMSNWLGDHFILYRPKDIVSGDFYWATTYKEKVVFCVADCTGHGVPGAFMSMLCISFLNEIVVKDKVMHTDEVLNRIRTMIIDALKQRGVTGEQKDGMDISLCIYNKDTSELEFSGANNPLYIIRSKEKIPVPSERQTGCDEYILYELRSDRMPIAIYDRMDPFERQIVRLLKDDRLYLFSDGFCDQFGGPYGKRLKNIAFKNSLLATLTPEIKDQGNLIESVLDKWQSHINPRTGQPYSQIDDICVMGLKI